MTGATPEQIRSQIDHPIIDIDGHTVEFFPALEPFLREEGVDLRAATARRVPGSLGPVVDWYALTPEERTGGRVARGPWGGNLGKTIDAATALLPALFYERLDELGIDFSVVYPSMGLLFPHLDDPDDRAGACRALNRFNAELFAPYGDRMCSVAEIPMHTPEEAIAELDHAVGTLGFKAVVMPNYVQRPVADVAARYPEAAPWALWTDSFGHDSAYDYDPVWARCRDLGVSPSFHSAAMGWQNRRSTTSYVYNHVGMLAESHHTLAKSLVLGGVTRRFPELNFGFMEGGVAWLATLLADLLGHWEKRNGPVMRELNVGYERDEALFADLFQRYGGAWADLAPAVRALPPQDLELIDEFAACEVTTARELTDLLVPSFYAGCEADDPMTSTAFNTTVNPFRSRFGAMFGSDVSHWDVPDMSEVLGEAWEMVEHEHITRDDFRDFMCTNPVHFYTKANPGFFKGTRVEQAAAEVPAR